MKLLDTAEEFLCNHFQIYPASDFRDIDLVVENKVHSMFLMNILRALDRGLS